MGTPHFMLEKMPEETWRDAAARVAKPHGLVTEVLEAFDIDVSNGSEQSSAAWSALYDWDCLALAPRFH